MGKESAGLVTQMLRAASDGDPQAAADLLPLVYSELRKLARARMAKTPPGNTLQPTALVHEAYLRLIGRDNPSWNSRGHFFAAAAQAMRQILVEQARRKFTLKRGGNRKRIPLDEVDPAIEPPPEDVLALNEGLTHLEKVDPRKGQIVMLRYFAGLTTEETAAALSVSAPTVEREWRFARAFLYTLLANPESHA
ncbi:MAG: sigma-70 family RNA polymerase sigma factor [Phycisphaerales bacterium]|nr:MAG: sigma-70 family RNA polymerase sigma factor [Phycisphaerales bacterium]